MENKEDGGKSLPVGRPRRSFVLCPAFEEVFINWESFNRT